MAARTVNVRTRDNVVHGAVALDDFARMLDDEKRTRGEARSQAAAECPLHAPPSVVSDEWCSATPGPELPRLHRRCATSRALRGRHRLTSKQAGIAGGNGREQQGVGELWGANHRCSAAASPAPAP